MRVKKTNVLFVVAGFFGFVFVVTLISRDKSTSDEKVTVIRMTDSSCTLYSLVSLFYEG